MATLVQENSPLFYDIFIDMTVDFVVLNFICDGKNKNNNIQYCSNRGR